MSKFPTDPRPSRRRGTLYISVLAVATIVSIIGFSAIHVARLHLTAAADHSDRYNARLLAMSAIEHAITEFNKNSSWKTDYTPGVEYPTTPPSLSGGTFAWKIIDLGMEQRQLQGIGRVGEARCAYQVNLGVQGTWLECGLLAGGNVSVGVDGKASDVTVAGAPLCTNGVFTNVMGTTTANVEAQAINGAVTGTKTAPATMRALPDPDDVFRFYLAHGTPLGANEIKRQLISPSSNPNGATNPDGIYVIDAGGASVKIGESRIVGTIVVLNALHVELYDQINWEPARPNFPALIVQGDIRVRLIDGPLVELDEGVNFNPPGTPYRSATDSAQDDEFSQIIAGIVYCTGNMFLEGNNSNSSAIFDGVMIVNGTGVVDKEANVTITYNSVHLDDPPPGFRPTASNTIKRGSWRQVPAS